MNGNLIHCGAAIYSLIRMWKQPLFVILRTKRDFYSPKLLILEIMFTLNSMALSIRREPACLRRNRRGRQAHQRYRQFPWGQYFFPFQNLKQSPSFATFWNGSAFMREQSWQWMLGILRLPYAKGGKYYLTKNKIP